jgi:hypothetical protein
MVYRDFTPENGGVPTNQYQLMFDCPICGPPYSVSIYVGLEPPSDSPRRWHVDSLPVDGNWVKTLTVSPSIDNTKAGHGRKHPVCGFHGSIVNGEII